MILISGIKLQNIVLMALLLLGSCQEKSTLPLLTTESITEVTGRSAVSGGNISSDGGSDISGRGVCWATQTGPTINDEKTTDGSGKGSFTSNLTDLQPATAYYVRAYATNGTGTAYGNEIAFVTDSENSNSGSQIIADHTVVDKYDDIPEYYINEVKKMWLSVPGESHATAYIFGLELLESLNSKYAVNTQYSGAPESYTTSHLRANNAFWGDFSNPSGWTYSYGEEDWWTNETAIARTKAGISYCKTSGNTISAIGFGWCTDMFYGYIPSSVVDPVYGCYWYGASKESPSGDRCWGLDEADNAITGNVVNLDTYLHVTQQYIDYCKNNGISTKVFFTTGPVDRNVGEYNQEKGYGAHLKMERIRDYVKADASRILFDYADILCYDNAGNLTTDTWNGHTFPIGAAANVSPEYVGHITNAGCIRLAKALWWMMARMAGWDGN